MMTHISQSVSVQNITFLMVLFTNIINLYDNILINKYQVLITCNRPTPLHVKSRHFQAMQPVQKVRNNQTQDKIQHKVDQVCSTCEIDEYYRDRGQIRGGWWLY